MALIIFRRNVELLNYDSCLHDFARFNRTAYCSKLNRNLYLLYICTKYKEQQSFTTIPVPFWNLHTKQIFVGI